MSVGGWSRFLGIIVVILGNYFFGLDLAGVQILILLLVNRRGNETTGSFLLRRLAQCVYPSYVGGFFARAWVFCCFFYLYAVKVEFIWCDQYVGVYVITPSYQT